MAKVIRINESTLKNMIMEAISYEMEERQAEDILEYFESQDVSWKGCSERRKGFGRRYCFRENS